MRNFLSFSLLLILGLYSLGAQDKQARKYARTITISDLRARLAVLAADSLEGRETGTPGQHKAARFIADHFRRIGLEPVVPARGGASYFQPVKLLKGSIHEVYLKKGENTRYNLRDFVYYSRAETFGEEHIQMIYVDSVHDSTLDFEDKFVVFRSADGNWQQTAEALKQQNVGGFVVINDDKREFDFMLKQFAVYFKKPAIRASFDNAMDKVLMVDTGMLEWLFDRPADQIPHGEEVQVIFNADMHIEPMKTDNVLGFLRGARYPDEVIVITSHYDHLGMHEGEIYNGADDDGSGTTTVMEIAEAFALAAKKGKRPDRSLLFMCVTGEEKGLLGSEYYTENPIFPLENTVTNLNIDMIGRVDPAHEKSGNPNYIYLIGSDKLSQDLHEISEKVNANTEKLELDYTYNDENDPNRYYYRSDHYNFAKHNVPIIFYFNGTHADYHKPTDTIEKIHFEKMQKIVRLIYYTAWEVANREERIRADKPAAK